MKYILNPFVKIIDIKGQASQKEFWIYQAFFIFFIGPLIGFLRGLDSLNDTNALIIRLVFLIPGITLGMRRLNETKFNKWFFLIPFVNLILASFPAENE